MIGEKKTKDKKKDRITYVDTTTRAMVVVRAKVCERRQAQRQARQAKSKKKNRYVIKVMVMNEHREAGRGNSS